MQTYALKLATLAQAVQFTLEADRFVYESGATTPEGGDTRIKVKADTGAEIVLRPGQWFRLSPEEGRATRWQVQAFDPVAVIDGAVIIGSGEFGDANTLNKFKLDATFANNVKVTNTGAGEAVPVAIASGGVLVNNTTGQRVPVTFDTAQTLNVNVLGQTVQYTNAWNAGGNADTGGAIPIFLPASNPNGAYIEFAEVSMANGGSMSPQNVYFMAKTTAPAAPGDGDQVMTAFLAGCSSGTTAGTPFAQVNQVLGVRIKIPAGKGLYYWQVGAGSISCNKTVLYTLL